jgi:TPR repeat protein
VQPGVDNAALSSKQPSANNAGNTDRNPAAPSREGDGAPRTDAAASPKSADTTPAKTVNEKSPAPAPEDALEVDGEHYLYGPQSPGNCARAEKDFMEAASHDSAKAESILGTMYATGHCVPQDLPLAYRWFAKALQQEPRNSRLEEDVQVVWNQMTADQKQLATRH